jgi:nucleoside-diphosphate-sugar epimerase
MNERISIVGSGWLAKPLAAALKQKGYEVRCSNRSGNKPENFPVDTIKLVIDEHHVECSDPTFFDVDVLIVAIPPGRKSDPEFRHPKEISQLLKLVKSSKIIFVSSTSVYPDTNGSVDELCDLPPDTSSGKALKHAEQLLRDVCGDRLTVVRFSGLIGGDRMPGRFLAGKSDVENPDAPVNLIHQTDCVRVLMEIIRQNAFGYTFNACADEHPTRRKYYTEEAEKLGLKVPEFSSQSNGTFKIVDASFLKSKLGFEFQYPDPQKIDE